jgi:hypothetical protein
MKPDKVEGSLLILPGDNRLDIPPSYPVPISSLASLFIYENYMYRSPIYFPLTCSYIRKTYVQC